MSWYILTIKANNDRARIAFVSILLRDEPRRWFNSLTIVNVNPVQAANQAAADQAVADQPPADSGPSFLFNTISIELHFLELFDDALQDTIKAAYTNWAEKMQVFFDSFAKKEVQVVISEEV